MKQDLIFLPLLLLLASQLNAQKPAPAVEVSTGISIYGVKSINGFPGEYDFLSAINGNIAIEWPVVSGIFIKSQFGFIQNGYYFHIQEPLKVETLQAETSYFAIHDYNTNRNLNSDWLVGYSIGKKVQVKIAVGSYLSYYLNTKNHFINSLYIDPEEYDFIGDPALPVGYSENTRTYVMKDPYVRALDFGFAGQLGFSFLLKQGFSISLNIDSYIGLTDQDLSLENIPYPPEKYNRTMLIKLGYIKKLGHENNR